MVPNAVLHGAKTLPCGVHFRVVLVSMLKASLEYPEAAHTVLSLALTLSNPDQEGAWRQPQPVL